MNKFMLAAGVVALAITTPALADKGGKGGGPGGGNPHQADHGNRGGGQSAKAERRGGGEARQRGPERRASDGQRRQENRQVRSDRRAEHRSAERREDRVRARVDDRRQVHRDEDRRQARFRDRRDDDRRIVEFRDRRDGERDRLRFVDRDDRPRDGVRFQFAGARRDGCPPGLARKHNGCMPPGQLKQRLGQSLGVIGAASVLPSYYRNWYPDSRDYYYRAGDDFIYRIDRDDDRIAGYMPLFGRNDDWYPDYYTVGDPYPMDYVSFYNVPAAYQGYYPDAGDYLYRYGDGAIYRVNRSNGLVDSIVELLAGNLGVGSALPAGYDVYNVPYAYRDRYYDTPDHLYRYSDGYIYQVDPKTRLIQAVISALV